MNCPYCGKKLEKISADEFFCNICNEYFVDNELDSAVPIGESNINEDDDDEDW